MNKTDVEIHIKDTYPQFNTALKKIEKNLVKALNYYRRDKPDLIRNEDFRPGTISRLLSCILSNRFLLNRALDYINIEGWEKDFQEEYVPEPFQQQEYYGHFKGIDLALRFHLFHAVYHNIETTFRIICEELRLKGKPVKVINKQTKIYPKELIEIADAIRNTIHNNGYYLPQGKQKEYLKYENQKFKIEFKKGKPIEPGTVVTIYILEEYINCTIKMLKHKVIEAIPIIEDRSK